MPRSVHIQSCSFSCRLLCTLWVRLKKEEEEECFFETLQLLVSVTRSGERRRKLLSCEWWKYALKSTAALLIKAVASPPFFRMVAFWRRVKLLTVFLNVSYMVCLFFHFSCYSLWEILSLRSSRLEVKSLVFCVHISYAVFQPCKLGVGGGGVHSIYLNISWLNYQMRLIKILNLSVPRRQGISCNKC